ncbi:LCP family protein [Metabacillus fastidiosus]|uniref:LCP family protein n=1 Tax=Metabacillus fastidiosus TaxID=1458 RepID=UPI002E222EB4|nr:LCP family protein [Metabacillus fastidiosus]
MRSARHQKKKRRLKRRAVFILFSLFTVCIAGAAYFYSQYKDAFLKSNDDTAIAQTEYDFDGKKDKYGNTNILLLGSDSRGEEHARTDTIMIAQYNSKNSKPKMVSIMRDSYVEIPGHGMNKINAAFAYGGPELLRQTLKENFDIDLQYYAILDFQGFVKMVDIAFPEGIEIDVEKRMSKKIGVTLEPGRQMLDGKELLGYVRFRQDAIGDFGRVDRQQQAIKAISDQIVSVDGITKLPKIVGAVSPFVNTNIGVTDTIGIGKDILSGGSINIESLRIPVDNGYENRRVDGVGAVLDIDLDKNKTALHEFLDQ